MEKTPKDLVLFHNKLSILMKDRYPLMSHGGDGAILSSVVQFNYNAVNSQPFSAALLRRVLVNGAGALSLDALLRRG
jgi:hypothetical protein